MKNIHHHILLLLLFFPLFSFSQQVENVHFEQVGKQIHIFYNLKGPNPLYNIKLFCSTDNGQTWGVPLKKVIGAVGENQPPGNGKEIIWDVLAEREELKGKVVFKIEAGQSNAFGQFVDERDGQIYKWVKIGTQVWMAENLNYKTPTGSWECKYDSKNSEVYGRLYNWNTALKACPDGWHLSSDKEWRILEKYLGLSDDKAYQTGWRGTDEGERLKSTSSWKSDGNGTDVYGFTALPGGGCFTSGKFEKVGNSGYWWSALEYDSKNAWYRRLDYKNNGIRRSYYSKENGYSVRCVKDN
jgi:uncharacterized protein (TIGR02145 family)